MKKISTEILALETKLAKDNANLLAQDAKKGAKILQGIVHSIHQNWHFFEVLGSSEQLMTIDKAMDVLKEMIKSGEQ